MDKAFLKKKAAGWLAAFSADRLITSIYKRKACVLLFHRIGSTGSPLWPSLSSDAFRKILRYVKKEYRIVSISEYAEARLSGERVVSISFDDGFRDFYTHAWPILQEEGISCVNHNLIPTCIETGIPPWTSILHARMEASKKQGEDIQFSRKDGVLLSFQVGKEGAAPCYQQLYTALCQASLSDVSHFIEEQLMPFAAALSLPDMMNASEIRELIKEGMEIGAHSYSHLMLHQCQDKTVLNREVIEAKSYLEQKFDGSCTCFAFPNGICDPDSLAAVKAAGYKQILMAGMVYPWMDAEDRQIIQRTSVHHEDHAVNRLRIALQAP